LVLLYLRRGLFILGLMFGFHLLITKLINYMYIISPITVFDNDHELWETHVGVDSDKKPLCYSVWGKTEQISRVLAAVLVETLNNQP